MRISNYMYVNCSSCGHRHYNDDNLVTENIEEDIQGRDVLTFVCPNTKVVVKALVMIGHDYDASDDYWHEDLSDR